MEIEALIKKNKELYSVFLDFIDAYDNPGDKFGLLINYFEKEEILLSQDEIQIILQLISQLSDNHHRSTDFFNRFKQIFQYIFKDKQFPISKYIPEFQKYNKRILFLLFKEGFLIPDKSFLKSFYQKYDLIQSQSLSEIQLNEFYFLYPSIKKFIDEEKQEQIENDILELFELEIEEFEKKCQIGENDSYICSLIRQDLVEEFITYVNKTNLCLSNKIKPTIFETNSYLQNTNPTLIKYALFFGSIKIIQYLKNNNINFDASMWIYAIHSNNSEIIQLLEEDLETDLFKNYERKTIDKIIKESIKCHHNDISSYIIDNYYTNVKDKSMNYEDFTAYFGPCIIKSLNFFFYPNKIDVVISKSTSEFNVSYLCYSLKEITIPSSVISIGYCAFSKCSSLTKITIPSSVVLIGESAFFKCSSLTQITIPSSVTEIGSSAFYECSSLTQVTIPSSVTEIEDYAFSGCSALTKITIPSSVILIGEGAFFKCSSLTQITIPSFVTEIRRYTFYECVSLKQITIPTSVTLIGQYAFSGCSSLTQITIPFSVTFLGENSFSNCSSLAQITIPSSVTKIREYAFSNCSSLTQITIPSSVTSIGYHAFCGCSSLTQITILSSVISIDKSAFNHLTKINLKGSIKFIFDYMFYDCSSLNEITIPSSVTSIGNYAFSGCSSLIQIVIPSSVTEIGNNAFSGCSSLIQIAIPSSVTQIGNYVFCGCSSLIQITIPSSVTEIGSYAFSGCSSLIQITIPSSVTEIGSYAFSECSSLTQITIPSSVTKIGFSVFNNCSLLERVEICSSITTIEDYTFHKCSSLKEIILPSSVTSIGKYSFYACSSLNNFSIPSSVVRIGSYAFHRCSSFTEITIPGSVKTIEEGAFSWCSSLDHIIIPSSIVSIGEYSFCSCCSLKEINIPSSLSSIPKFLFSYCHSLTKITIPPSVKSIGDYAFFGCNSLIDIEIPSSVSEIGINSFTYCLSLKTLPDETKIINETKIISPTINIDDYEFNKEIRCMNSHILEAIHKTTNRKVVMKSYSSSYFKSNIEFMKLIDCARIEIQGFIKVQDFCFSSDHRKSFNFCRYATISEFVTNGDIESLTKSYLDLKGKQNGKMNPTIRSKIIYGVASIMKHLHDKNIIHRDLKLSKILLDDKYEPMILPSKLTQIVSDPNELDRILFTSYNMAPEMHLDTDVYCTYSFPVDVYAYAFFLYHMFSNNIIFGNTKDSYIFKRKILNGKRPNRPKNIPDHYWELIELCWSHNPEDRPTFEEIIDNLKNDIYALDEFGIKTNLDELHAYQKLMDF